MEELIQEIVRRFTLERARDYSLVSEWKIFVDSLKEEDIARLTLLLGKSGKVFQWEEETVDVPSTGGIGNSTPLIVSALLASCGLKVPKISGRSLKHTGGTIDILESVGYKAELSPEEFRDEVENYGYSIIAPAKDIAPWERVIYNFRRFTNTVENIPLIASSILAKKVAAGVKMVGIDVKVGKGGMFEDYSKAKELARTLVRVGRNIGIEVGAILSDINQLQGKTIGNRLVLKEVFETLSGKGPSRLTKIAIGIGAEILRMKGEVKTREEGETILSEKLKNGEALKAFLDLLKRHNANGKFLDNWELLSSATCRLPILSPETGKIQEIDLITMNNLCKTLIFENNQLRFNNTGVVLFKEIGDEVRKGEEVGEIYAENEEKANEVKQEIEKNVIKIGEDFIKYPFIYAFINDDREDEKFVEREISLSVGIIKLKGEKVPEFLLQFNKYWKQYNFISGKFEPDKDNDLKETILRETEEELGLKRNKDFVALELLPAPLMRYQFSFRHKKWTKYTSIGVYLIVFFDWEGIKSKIFSNEDNRIFTYNEMIENKGVSDMIGLIDKNVPGGLTSIPYSLLK